MGSERHETYAGLARNAGGDDNNIRALEHLLEAVVGREVSHDLGGRGDMRQVRSNTGRVHDIEQPELVLGHLLQTVVV